jgi:hypothetical protein
MPINKAQTANIQQYTESVNVNGEIHITGRFDGVQMDQTLPNKIPCIIMFDPEINNLVAVQDVANELRPGMKFVSVVTEATAAAKQN